MRDIYLKWQVLESLVKSGSKLALSYKTSLNAESHRCVVCHVQVAYVFKKEPEQRRKRKEHQG
jgi:hypothetical protein